MTSAPEDLDAAADELYGLPPQDFTARRDELSKAARSAGDRELAAAIKGLRRPTVAAWLVNLLVRDGDSELTELLDIGAQLREAQSQLAGERMRELTAARKALEGTLVRRAEALAAERGQAAAPAVLVEVEATLRAALADPRAADAVSSGRLTRALSYAGLGGVDVTEATATPPRSRPAAVAGAEPKKREGPGRTAAAPRTQPAPDAGPRAPQESPDELAARRRARLVTEREEALAEAEQRAREVEARLEQARENERTLRDLVDELQQRLKDARDALSEATREAASAERESDRARRAVATAERDLAKARREG